MFRTGYSFGAAVGQIDEIMEAGADFSPVSLAPLCDRASTFAFASWDKAARKKGLGAVFAVELAVTKDASEKRPFADYWRFIAKGDISEINRLVALATNQFQYQPLLTYEQALKADCFVVVGAASDYAAIDRRHEIAVELSPALSKGAFKMAQASGLPFIAMQSNFYPHKGDAGFYQAVCGRGARVQTYPQHVISRQEWRDAVRGTDTQKTAAYKLYCDVCRDSTAKLQKAEMLSPEKFVTLREMCKDAAPGLGIELDDPVYKERLDRELDLIKQKNFEDYFYLIGDLVAWARKEMAVGPARGSSCGSLVCYLLGITKLDPIEHGLLFERFIDVNRDDLPDIDIDFSDQNRAVAFQYLADKYGTENVARLGSVSMFKARSAMNEAAKSLGIPAFRCDDVLSRIEEKTAGDTSNNSIQTAFDTTLVGRKFKKDFPEMEIAARMEGHPRHFTQHAAGVVITNEPVEKFVAINSRTGATHCDKRDAEALGLLKVDALGLTQLSVFEDYAEITGQPHDFFDAIPLNEPDALKVINSGLFTGIFQFNGAALQKIANSVEIKNISDIVAITALARPGPLNSGAAEKWINRKTGKEKITFLHPSFESVLAETSGLMVYQEQLMILAREVGRMSWPDVTKLRKAVSKSMGADALAPFRDKWVLGAVATGLKENEAISFWNEIIEFGAYAFNKSHAAAYGLISYYCAWMKAKNPKAFAAATLNHEKDPQKQLAILRECADAGITYRPVDVKLSTDKWIISGDQLIGPVQNVKGVGPKLTQQIVSARQRGEPLPARAEKLLAKGKTEIETLFPIAEAFHKVIPDPEARNIFTKPTPIYAFKDKITENVDILIFGTIDNFHEKNENGDQAVAKRGYAFEDGMTKSVIFTIRDDTGTCLAKIGRKNFAKLSHEIFQSNKKMLFAFKGRALADYGSLVMVEAIRKIGEME